MRKFVFEILIVIICAFALIGTINYCEDPGDMFHQQKILAMAEALSEGKIVYSEGDMDERVFQENRIKKLNPTEVETLVLGSSHVMYIHFPEKKYYNAGVSGCNLEDYYGILGICEDTNIKPQKVIIGVDPYIFSLPPADTRYKSIQNYVDYEKSRVDGKQSVLGKATLNINKVFELFSPSYFQASILKIARNKRLSGFCKSGTDMSVEECENTDIEDRAKVEPNGTRIPRDSAFLTVEENNHNASEAIRDGRIYNLTELPKLEEERKEEFESLLDYLIGNDIEIELYMPTWYGMYYDYYINNPDWKGMIQVETYLRDVGSDRNIIVRGSFDPTRCNVSDDEFMDSFHMTPETMLREYELVF